MSDKKNYFIFQDFGQYNDDGMSDLNDAVALAEEFLGAVPPGTETTFTVEDEDGSVLATLTNRRIIGTLHKELYGGADVETVEFDATDAVLQLSHAELIGLEDGDSTAEAVGQQHIDGPPAYVALAESVCDYFGVGDVSAISEALLNQARARANPEPAAEETVVLSLRVKVSRQARASLPKFLKDLDCTVRSNTVGVVVLNTERIDIA